LLPISAEAVLQSYRKADFQVAVADVHLFGVLQVPLRDRYAGPHTPDTARCKALTAVSFRTGTKSLVNVSIKRVAERLIDLKVSVEADLYSSVHDDMKGETRCLLVSRMILRLILDVRWL
jgi:hypothetical protein